MRSLLADTLLKMISARLQLNRSLLQIKPHRSKLSVLSISSID